MSQPANNDYSQHLSDDEASYHEDASDNEYDIWAMGMDHYLEYINNDVWKVIQNGNSKKRISTGKDGVVRILPPVSAAEIHDVEKERKARTILLMVIPKEHLRRFHRIDNAKEIWEAIRTRFGGNANLKKMQKAVLKQKFKAFTISSSEGLEKGYDRFQQLLSQLEAHGAEVSTGDANHKFLRSLPPAWSNLAMTMRIKPDVDTLSIDDLYNNLRVFEQELTSTSKSSTSAQNLGKNIKGTNDGKKRDSFYQDQGARKKEQNQNCLLTMDDGVVNWGEHTVEKKIVDSWKDSSKNLWKLVNSGMTSNSKVGLGYGIKSNNEVLSYEEEMNCTVFNCTEEDFVDKPLYNRFSKTDNLKDSTPLTEGTILPKPQQEIDRILVCSRSNIPLKTWRQMFYILSVEMLSAHDCNKDHPDELFEECKGGSVTFGRTLIEAAKTMLAYSLLPTTFWAEAVSTACYIFNRASDEEDEAEELIIVPTVVQYTAAKKEVSPHGISEDAPDILAFRKELDEIAQKHLGAALVNKTTNTPSVNTSSRLINTGKFDASQHADPNDSDMPELEIFNRPKQGIFDAASYDEEGVVTDFNNLPTEVDISPIPTLRIHNIHPHNQILGDPKSAVQTRSKVQQQSGTHALLSYEEPKKISEALKDDSWVEAMQEELNKRDERGVVVRNKARLVAQGHRQEEGIDYDESLVCYSINISQPTTEPHPEQELETETELHGLSSDFVHTPPTQVETSSPELKSISPEPMDHIYDQPQPSPVQQPTSPEPQLTSPPKSPPLQGPTSTYAEATRINVADLLHLVPSLVTK
ncbi:ribonuclease H-like domain-containing protein [Tanacetum coccineum]